MYTFLVGVGGGKTTVRHTQELWRTFPPPPETAERKAGGSRRLVLLPRERVSSPGHLTVLPHFQGVLGNTREMEIRQMFSGFY